jgi:hypothetical protein
MNTYLGPMDDDRKDQLRRLGWTIRVRLDGVDITERCRFADDTPGQTVVDVECEDHATGRMYVAHLTSVAVTIECTR